MGADITSLVTSYNIEDTAKTFKGIIDYAEGNSLQELLTASEAYYKNNKKVNYQIYKKARLDELIRDGKYLDIIFHLFVRRIKPISRKILNAKGWEISEEYLTGKPFYYQFELFSLNNSLDMELNGSRDLAIKDLKENLSKYIGLYEKLEDEKSRAVLNAILMARLSKDPMYYFAINDQPAEKAYFDKGLVQCSEKEVFVDCGGYTGDTVKEYFALYGQDYKKIYVYEPSPLNYEKARRSLEGLRNIELRKLGVSDKSGSVFFSDGSNEAAAVSDEGKTRIELTTLDEDILEPVTFIKMDIEGQELPALKGTANHIHKERPKLSICLYHKIDDLWRIPEYISEANSDYKLYLRHYQNCYTETVLYAL